MKEKFCFLIIVFAFNLTLSAQNFYFLKFSSEKNEKESIATSELLKSLDWENLKLLSKSSEEHYTQEEKDSLLSKYEYVQQGRIADFKIISYKGKVLEYQSQISHNSKEANINFFDKSVWLEYTHNYLPNLPDSLKLDVTESKEILKSYYELIGVGTNDEYGWICEYSTVGMAPKRRIATIQLIKFQRVDLLKRLIEYPNLQVQLYVTDALIYIDSQKKNYIENNIKPELKQLTKQLDSLKSKKTKNWRIQSLKNEIIRNKEYIEELKSELLSKNDWKRIYALRDSNQNVNTCGNDGSYKIYNNTTADLLNTIAIDEIPKRYLELKKLGYFR